MQLRIKIIFKEFYLQLILFFQCENNNYNKNGIEKDKIQKNANQCTILLIESE